MSEPTAREVQRLSQVADELREVVAERGYRVDEALEADRAFGSGMSRAWLGRDLAIEAIRGAASRAGIDFRSISGGGLELQHREGVTDRRYRVRKARRTADGSLAIPENSASGMPAAEDTLLDRDHWVLAWVLSPEGLVEEVLISEVLGATEGNPGHLLLGKTIPLESGEVATGGFEPADEDLPGFEDSSDEGLDEPGA